MKFSLGTVVAISTLLFKESAAVPADTMVDLESRRVADAQACADPTLVVPLFRLWNPSSKDDFYTTNANEKQNAITSLGYNDEGVAGWVWPSAGRQTFPLYRLYNGKPGVINHFYTTSITERNNQIANAGYTDEGIAAYVYNDPLCGGLPFYYVWSSAAQNSFYTMDAQERDDTINGDADKYISEGVRGFLLRF